MKSTIWYLLGWVNWYFVPSLVIKNRGKRSGLRRLPVSYSWKYVKFYIMDWSIGHLHDGVILLLWPECFSFFLSYLNFVIPVMCTKQKPLFAQESKTLKDSGRSSKMMSSCKWPIIGWCWVSYQKLGRTGRVSWRPKAEADNTFRDLILHIVQKSNNGVLFSQNISNFKACVPRSTLKVPISIGLLFGKYTIAKGCLHY